MTTVIQGEGNGADLYFDLKIPAKSAFQIAYGDFKWANKQSRKQYNRNTKI